MFESLRAEARIMPKKVCMRRNRLSQNEKRIYDEMCRAISQRRTEVTVAIQGEADIGAVVHAIFLEQPFFYYLDKKGMSFSKSALEVTIRWQFRMKDMQMDIYDRQIEAQLREFKPPVGGDELKLEIYLHDIMQRIGIRAGESDWTDHTIIGPLLLGHTVCEGMSLLFLVLCTMFGIECMCVTGIGFLPGEERKGQQENHQWNIVRINEEYVHVDVFWDALLHVKEFNGYCYDYFNLSDRSMKRDHEWNQKDYPRCPTEKCSYFSFVKADIHSLQEYRELAQRCREKGKYTVTARMHYTYSMDACIDAIWEAYRGTSAEKCSGRINKEQRILEIRITRKK